MRVKCKPENGSRQKSGSAGRQLMQERRGAQQQGFGSAAEDACRCAVAATRHRLTALGALMHSWASHAHSHPRKHSGWLTVSFAGGEQ